jgi:hypothetical protein
MQRNDCIFIYEKNIKKKQQQLQHSPHQQQLQEQRPPPPLSLSDISPTWAIRLKEKQPPLFLISFTRLQWLSEITDAEKCVVGEAYGFSSSYTNSCRECTNIANKFSLYFVMNHPRKLKENRQRFVKHWNEKHLEK